MCVETATTLITQQTNLIYTSQHADADSKDMRRKCICDISPTYENTSVELKLIDVSLMDKNLSCTATKLKLSDSVLLACGVFTGLSLTLKESFTIELEMSTREPPDIIWISVKGIKCNPEIIDVLKFILAFFFFFVCIFQCKD